MIPVFGLLKRGGGVRVSLPFNCSEKHLLGAILENVELDSIVYSDGWKAYNKLSLNGFHHRRIKHDKTLVDAKIHINGFENFWGYAKRRLKTITVALNVTSGSLSEKGRSASTIATPKTRYTFSGADCALVHKIGDNRFAMRADPGAVRLDRR